MRSRLRMDVLRPSTEWCWLHGPRGVSVPGATLDSLARALAAEGDGALLVHRGRGYVLRWEDSPAPREDSSSGREDEAATQWMRRYELSPRYLCRTLRRPDDGRSLPGPFVELVALSQESRRNGALGVDAKSMRDAIWWLLSRAEAALESEAAAERATTPEAEAMLQPEAGVKALREPFSVIDRLASA